MDLIEGDPHSYALEYRYSAQSLGDPVDVDGVTMSKQNLIADHLLLMNPVCWLLGPLSSYAAGFFHFRLDGDYRVLRSAGGETQVRLFNKEEYVLLDESHISLLRDLWSSLISLKRTSSLWIATWMLHKALYERFWFIRVLLMWITLEALFGPENKQQLTHQLCERVALFLKGASSQGQELFLQLKKSYDIRSKVVHGGALGGGKNTEWGDNVLFVEGVVREAMLKILQSEELKIKFSTKARDPYLQGLIFGIDVS